MDENLVDEKSEELLNKFKDKLYKSLTGLDFDGGNFVVAVYVNFLLKALHLIGTPMKKEKSEKYFEYLSAQIQNILEFERNRKWEKNE